MVNGGTPPDSTVLQTASTPHLERTSPVLRCLHPERGPIAVPLAHGSGYPRYPDPQVPRLHATGVVQEHVVFI